MAKLVALFPGLLFVFFSVLVVPLKADPIDDYKKTNEVSVFVGSVDTDNSDLAEGPCKVLLHWKKDAVHHGKQYGKKAFALFFVEKTKSESWPKLVEMDGVVFGATPNRTNAILNAYEKNAAGTTRKELRFFFKDRKDLSNEELSLVTKAEVNYKRPAFMPEDFSARIVTKSSDQEVRCKIEKVIQY